MLRRQVATVDGSRASQSQDEAYRVLRSNVNIALADLERPTVVVSSAWPGEGKTATSVKLARSMAQAGQRVVLVDLDLRHPDTHRWLGLHNEFGVSDVLLQRRSLEDCLQFVDVGQDSSQNQQAMYLLSTGNGVSNPTELLGTRRTVKMLEVLAEQADVVLIDTPPVLPVADTRVIGRMVAGAILVVETRKTTVPAVLQARDALIKSQTRLLGVVVNKLRARDAEGGYGYGYGYGYPANDGE